LGSNRRRSERQAIFGDNEVLRRLIGLAALLAGTLLYAGAVREVPSPATARVAVLDLAGKTVDPFEVAGGKPLVFIFVRTDCPVSNRYAPTIQALSTKYAGKAVLVLVYPDKSETPVAIEKHLHEYGYKNEAVRDTQHNLVKLSKVEITPEAAVFNGKGELIYHGRIDNWYKEFGHARSAPTTHELDEAIQATLNSGGQVPASVSGVGCYISDLQ
jgi:thiol-disulfide isomerase/thioredoxin